jgi:single-stranded-DNA-specific exonuclease
MLQAIADDHLTEFGGHERAGGFSLASAPSPEFARALSATVDQFQFESEDDLEPVLAELSDLGWSLYLSLQSLGPFGVGCQQPLFRVTNVSVDDVRRFGSDNGHVALTVTDGDQSFDAVAFFAENSMKQVRAGDTVTIVGALEKTTFGFEKKLRFRMEELSVV